MGLPETRQRRRGCSGVSGRSEAWYGVAYAFDRGGRRVFALTFVAARFCLAGPARAGAPTSRCVECHVALPSAPEVAVHIADWQQSKHASHDVGCERCHGGDPTEAQALWAHRGVVHSTLPTSSVHRTNLYRTCAPCHPKQAGAFATSLHRVLLDADEARAPSCSTCHGAIDVRVPVPGVLEARCAGCHPPGSARADYPRVARAGIDDISRLRATLADLSPRISVLDGTARRGELGNDRDRATRAVTDAVSAFHAFDLRRMNESLEIARRETDRLARELER